MLPVYITYIIILIVMLLVATTEKSRQIRHSLDLSLITHQDILSTNLILNEDFGEKYPEFFKILKSFDGADLRYVLDNPNMVQKLPDKEVKVLKREMNEILAQGNSEDRILLKWYMATCATIEISKERHFESKQEIISRKISENKTVSKNDIDTLDTGLCYS